MKIIDKNIDVKNARYWSALNDKQLITILKDICKKSKGKQQLNESAALVIAGSILSFVITTAVCAGISWYWSKKGYEQQEQANKASLDQQKLDAYKNSDTIVANPKTLQFDHDEVVKVVTNILAPTGSKVDVTYTDIETGRSEVAVADEYVKVDQKVDYVVRTVYNVLKNDKGEKKPTKDELIQMMDDLKNGKKYLTTKAPQTGMDWNDFAVNMKIVDAESFKRDTGITDFKSQCRLMSFDNKLNAWTINGQEIAKMPNPKQAIETAKQQQEMMKDPALEDTSKSKWPWILGIAAAAVGIPLLWSCLSRVSKEVKTSKMLAKCEFTCEGSSSTYCFGFNLQKLQWTLSYKDSSSKPSSEETSSFAQTQFAKKFADAVEVQMKSFYNENGSKSAYKAVEVAGKDKAQLIKALYDSKDAIEKSLYNMSKCEAA